MCDTPSDINCHLPTLKSLAEECTHITEFGVRTWLSSVALLMWLKKNKWIFHSYDLYTNDDVKRIQKLDKSEWYRWRFKIWDSRYINIQETDMLFIDTIHDWDQLEMELDRHAHRVRKYIAFHDTTTFGERWETKWHKWLLDAMDNYQRNHSEWRTKEVYKNNNGLTVWERKTDTPKITVYTAIYWDFDPLKFQPKQSVDCEYVCFTDNLHLSCESWAESQWRIIQDTRNRHLHPRMRAKYFRTHPYEFFPNSDYVIWIDGSAKLQRNDSIEFFINHMKEKSDIMTWKHPDRDCILDEAKFSLWIKFKKYESLPLVEQAEHYISLWYPEHYWLSATWLLVTRPSHKIIEFFHERWNECLEWTYQDQISFDYLVWKNFIKRQWINNKWNLWINDYIDFRHPHRQRPKVLLSIVMPVYNHSDLTKAAIENILDVCKDLDFEFIIINDWSTDDTDEVVYNFYSNKIKYVKLNQNVWVTKVRNKWVMEYSRWKYICVVNNDIIFPQNFFEKLINGFEDGIMTTNPRLTEMPFGRKSNVRYYYNHICGPCWMVMRKDVDKLFPIDERLKNFWNDNWLTFKVWDLWGRHKVVKDAIMHHLLSQTTKHIENTDVPMFNAICYEEWRHPKNIRPLPEDDLISDITF